MQAATDQLYELIGQHRDEQVAVDPRLGAVIDRAQAQFGFQGAEHGLQVGEQGVGCLLYTSDAADERSSVDLGGRRIIKKKTNWGTQIG